ncbi:MAG: hypothetical protein F6K35_41725 [Okeania sp. SIO2H7]|nr:hypothetical protein [Okeania sp. SIO2H7]
MLGGLIVAIAATTARAQANQVQNSSKFYCGDLNGTPATYVRARRGSVPIIVWVDDSFPAPWDPLTRCRDISARFQRFYDNGQLNYIKAGRLNRQSVLCITRTQPGECLSGGLLITLKPETNPQLTLQRLRDIQISGSGVPIELSASQQIFYINGEAYLNMRAFLEDAPKNNDDGPLW